MALVNVARCPKCGRGRGERHKATKKAPGVATMERWMSDAVARATDGCKVEPDGYCEHGHASYLLVLGVI